MRATSTAPTLMLTASLTAIACPAFAIDLNGAWATDANVCAKVFVKKDNKIAFTPNSSEFGGGFIIEGNKIHGQSQSCSFKAKKEDGSNIHMLATCTTDIMASNVQFSAKIINDNAILRYFPGMSDDLGMPYARCSM